MRRSLIALVLASAALSNSAARADNWWTRFWCGVHADMTDVNMWPQQYVGYDRMAARAPFDVMVANGWRVQNTLSNYHFRDGGTELNDAGVMKLRYILTETPMQYRQVYVLRGDKPEVTLARLQTVEAAVAALSYEGTIVPVMETTVPPRGTSADYVNEVYTRARGAMRDPVLPAASTEDEGN